jgi:hypothetical protein
VSGLSTEGRPLTPGYGEPLRGSLRVAEDLAGWRFGLRHLRINGRWMFSDNERYAEAFQMIGVGLIILSGAAFFAANPISIRSIWKLPESTFPY